MKYWKSMIILVLAILIFCVASVCASDVNDTMIASEDDIAIELSQVDSDEIVSAEENELISSTEKEEIINEENVGTF